MKYKESINALKNAFKENDLLLQNGLNLRLGHIVSKIANGFFLFQKDERKLTICSKSVTFVRYVTNLTLYVNIDYVYDDLHLLHN